MRTAALILLLALNACAAGPGPGRGPGMPDRHFTSPSALVAAELAFNRLAQEKGQWAAFAEMADDTAVMFAPQPVNAKQWLKGRADPAAKLTWQPHQVWMSCDGSLGATRGAWQNTAGKRGEFTTAWKRQPDGTYKWVMDQGDERAEPLAAPELIAGKLAACGSKPEPRPVPQYIDGVVNGGQSEDGTMIWQTWTRPNNWRRVTVELWQDGKWQPVIYREVTP